jgi:hypothetical protein
MLIKNVIKIFLLASLFTTKVFSSDLLVNTTIDDAKGDAVGGWKYEVDRMDIKWTQEDQITVDIYTNFVDYNNQLSLSGSDKKIVMGDLLMSTNGDNTPFNYAFLLSDADRQQSNYYTQNHWDKTGTFSQIAAAEGENENTSAVGSKKYHGQSSAAQNGKFMARNTVGVGIQSNWSVDRQNAGASYNNFDKISFSFNVSGIDAFKNSAQIAFSWTMSCANDIVDGVVNVDRPTNVPEPAMFLLMLIGLGFIANAKKRKQHDFSA